MKVTVSVVWRCHWDWHSHLSAMKNCWGRGAAEPFVIHQRCLPPGLWQLHPLLFLPFYSPADCLQGKSLRRAQLHGLHDLWERGRSGLLGPVHQRRVLGSLLMWVCCEGGCGMRDCIFIFVPKQSSWMQPPPAAVVISRSVTGRPEQWREMEGGGERLQPQVVWRTQSVDQRPPITWLNLNFDLSVFRFWILNYSIFFFFTAAFERKPVHVVVNILWVSPQLSNYDFSFLCFSTVQCDISKY